MDPQRVDELIETYRGGLLDDTLPFWIEHSVDRQHGGFTVALDRDGSILDTDKGMWQQCRFTWLLGELYNNTGPLGVDDDRRQRWLELCRHGIEFIDRFGFDPADGRMWFHVTREGRPIRKRRYAFTESFAAIAYGEYARAVGSEEHAEKARRCFRRFVDHNLRPEGVAPKHTDVRPMKAIGFPMITIVTAQQLRDSIGLDDADDWIDRGIDAIRRDFIKDDLEVVMEAVGPRGEIRDHFDGRTLNPGHAVEAAWFIMHEGSTRGDRRLIETGCTMLDWMWRRGWDEPFGGMLYFVDLKGLPVQEYWHDMKFWWPHSETIIATLLAHTLTGDAEYHAMHAQVHDWSYRHFPDAEFGEWFGYLHRDGRISVPLKGNLWKGPFHLPRMQFVCWQLLDAFRSGPASR
ncbi:MAG: AGE family epimerase/isomerase [Planctomycetota bacterium]|jgi:N-acylglucosamine 2-epimerase